MVREIELLRQAGHRVCLIAPARSEVYRRAMQRGLPVVACGFERRHFIREVRRLKSIFEKIAPDVVATHSSRDGWVAGLAARLASVPLSVKYRHVSVPVKNHPLNRWHYRRLNRAVLATSGEILERLSEGLGLDPARLFSVPTGVDLSVFRPDAPAAGLRAELGLDARSPLIGVVSVLRSWKGHDVLIRAMQSLAADFPDLRLVIVGEGGQRRNLERLVLDLGLEQHVFFLGHRENVAGILRELDALVLPSVQKEGIPQAILQGFAAGVPVIGTDIGGIREVLNGDRGWLVPARDPAALARAVGEALRDPGLARKKAESALDYVRGHHSEEKMIGATLDIYGRLRDGSRR